MPFVGGMDAQPREPQCKCDNRPGNEDPRPPGAIISEASEDEEQDDLDPEGNAIGEEDDGVDGAVAAEEGEGFAVAGGEVEEVLEGGGGEVEES